MDEKLATEVLRLELHWCLDESTKTAEGKSIACARNADARGLPPSPYMGVERCDPASGEFSRR